MIIANAAERKGAGSQLEAQVRRRAATLRPRGTHRVEHRQRAAHQQQRVRVQRVDLGGKADALNAGINVRDTISNTGALLASRDAKIAPRLQAGRPLGYDLIVLTSGWQVTQLIERIKELEEEVARLKAGASPGTPPR